MNRLLILILSILCLFNTHAAWAETTSPTKDSAPSTHRYEPTFPLEELLPKPTPQDDKFLSELFNMLASLGLIVALIILVGWFLKRLATTRLEQANVVSTIKILEKRALSPKSMIYLLEIEGTGILIAESANGVTRLSEFPIAPSEPATAPPSTPPPSFSKLLDR